MINPTTPLGTTSTHHQTTVQYFDIPLVTRPSYAFGGEVGRGIGHRLWLVHVIGLGLAMASHAGAYMHPATVV
jgi:hypothetical protein